MYASDVQHVPICQLTVSGHQVRTHHVARDLSELVDNIRVHGQLEPILVCPNGEEGRLEIVAGQRRWLAMRELGYETIAAVVLHERLDETTAKTISISENLIRHDVEATDLIDACTHLYRRYGSVKRVAEKTGLPYERVRRLVKFERLRPELKQFVESGVLDIQAALKVEDHCAAIDADAEQCKAIVAEVKGMTKAQQADFFRRSRTDSANGAKTDRSSTRSPLGSSSRPGSVHQILVTLPTDDYHKLRQLAAKRRITQDKAAALIVNGYFRHQEQAARESG